MDTHGNLVERWCSMTVQSLMNFVPGKPFYIFVLNMTANPASFPRFMIVDYVPRAPTCIIHARDDDPNMWTDDHPIPTHCDRFNSDPIINAVRYKPPESRDKQTDRHIAVEQSDEIWRTNWRKDITLLDEYSASGEKLINMLPEFKIMWDENAG